MSAIQQTNKQAMPNALREVAPLSFIFEQPLALPSEQCTRIIEDFEQATDEQYEGHVGQGAQVEATVKKSTDIFISGKPQWQETDTLLFHSLATAIRHLCQKFPYFGSGFKDMGYGLQRTLPGEYYHWHIDGGSHAFSQRQLVAIWYLNDVAGPGGETEFSFQNVQVKPECGKLILFPPFWTHEHRGVTLQAGVKYIATTWIVFA
ncbi:MAG: 2OG-Fe(II) oxygenase [Candidatus Oxydemutatoraceae bacterium WSBS_2016_MAG_OTU14]